MVAVARRSIVHVRLWLTHSQRPPSLRMVECSTFQARSVNEG